jgi:hypothetical protein
MRRTARLTLLTLAGALCFVPTAAQAAGPPQLGAAWTTEVSAGSATFHGEVNPEGESTTYRFEYLTDANYQANPPGERFNGAAKAPAGGSAPAGSGTSLVTVSQHVSALRAGTLYHYRLSATGEGTTTSSPQTFTTQALSGAFALPDGRGWEMVSPPDKNGGAIQGFGRNHGGGVLQAAAQGPGEITYTSASSFGGEEAKGAPQGSQYISRRNGAAGWSTQNITTPIVSGSYGNDPNGVPYQLFSPDLARGLLLNGVHCRGEGTGCPVANPPLPGSGAPSGFQDYYLRNDEAGSFQALLSEANDGLLALSATQFNLAFAGASPDLAHVILSTCAKLTADATEVAGTEGCDPTKPNLYEWSGGALTLVNTSPGAKLAAQGGAVSADGSRVYFSEEGKLWLREGASAPHELALGGEFQTATPSGAIAFYTKSEHLFSYAAASHTATDLTPSGGVKGVLGASEDGTRVYYQDGTGLKLWHATTTEVAPGSQAASESDWPPTTGTARVSANGESLLFLSTEAEALSGYDNHDANTGQPDSEVYLYNAGALACVSCNPTGERPIGPSTIPGAIANGKAPGSTDAYKPRVLAATANRLFFDSSDALVALDTNKASDAYQWEAQGAGSCAKPGGCLSLISSGTDSQGASFVDATESGEDAYFLTSASLVGADPGSADVYDARVGGGFPEPTPPIPCEGDACAPLPPQPEDPTVGTMIPGPGNPPLAFPKPSPSCPKGTHRVIRHGKPRCIAKHRKGTHRKRGHK